MLKGLREDIQHASIFAIAEAFQALRLHTPRTVNRSNTIKVSAKCIIKNDRTTWCMLVVGLPHPVSGPHTYVHHDEVHHDIPWIDLVHVHHEIWKTYQNASEVHHAVRQNNIVHAQTELASLTHMCNSCVSQDAAICDLHLREYRICAAAGNTG